MDLSTLTPIGRGTTGEVYRTRDARTGEMVAVKRLRRPDPRSVTRLEREFSAQQSLNHPGLCKVHDLTITADDAFLTMELVEGISFHESLDELDIDARIRLMTQVVDAMAHAHEHGVIHRDLKPSNILISTTDGALQPKIVDFGLARLGEESTLTVPGEVLGTPAFMAPEQASGAETIDRRVDVYALGGLLYLALTDRLPHNGTIETVLREVRNGKLTRPGIVRTGIPSQLERVCLKAMAYRPESRYAHAAGLASDLRRYLRGEPVVAPSVMGSNTRRYWQTNRWPAVALIAGLAFAAVLTGVIVVGARDARQQAALAAQFAQTTERAANRHRLKQMVADQDMAGADSRLTQLARGFADEARDLGPAAQTAAQIAIGRLYSQTDRWDEALDAFQHASDARASQQWRGMARATLYRTRVRDALTVRDKDERQRLLAAAETEFAQPARQLLTGLDFTVADDNQDQRITRALLALTDADHDTARAELDAYLTGNPWHFESWVLIGESLEMQAAPMVNSGNWDGALDLRNRASDAYTRALQLAPSATVAHRRRCKLHADSLEMISYHLPALMDDAVPRSVEACTAAASNDTSSPFAHAQLAGAYLYQARTAMRNGSDYESPLDSALAAIERALALDEYNAEAWFRRANIHRLRGYAALDADRSPVIEVESGKQAIARALAIDPNHWRYLNTSANLSLDLAEWQLGNDADPLPALNESIQLWDSAVRNEVDGVVSIGNLAVAHSIRMDYLLAEDLPADDAVVAALAAYQQAQDANPADAFVYNNRGILMLNYARHEFANQRAYDEPLQIALADARHAVKLAPGEAVRYYNLGSVTRFAAEAALEREAQWRDLVGESIAALERAVELNGNDADNKIMLMRSLILEHWGESHANPVEEVLQDAIQDRPEMRRLEELSRLISDREYKDLGMTLLERDVLAYAKGCVGEPADLALQLADYGEKYPLRSRLAIERLDQSTCPSH